MKRKKLKKPEIIELFIANNVKTTNLKTFMRKKGLELSKYDQYHKWVKAIEIEKDRLLQYEWDKKQAQSFNMSVKKYRKLQDKAQHILSDFDTGHSMGYYSYIYINGRPFAMYDNRDYYAKSYKYKPNHGFYVIDMNKKELEKIVKFGGKWIYGQNGNKKILKAEGKKGSFDVYLVNIVNG